MDEHIFEQLQGVQPIVDEKKVNEIVLTEASKDDFIRYLEDTLIPDLEDSQSKDTARDFKEVVARLKDDDSFEYEHDSKEELVQYLKGTLIPDLKDSGKEATAEDFTEGAEWLDESIKRLFEGKSPPTCSKCNKAHWAFNKCSGGGEEKKEDEPEEKKEDVEEKKITEEMFAPASFDELKERMGDEKFNIAVKFINERWPGRLDSEGFTGYLKEWFDRFAKGTEWAYSDYTGREILMKIAPDVYPDDLDGFME